MANPKQETHFGDRLKLVMIHFQDTQTELADRLDVSQSSIPVYLSRKSFSPIILNRLSKLKKFGINPEFFRDPEAPMFLKEAIKQPDDPGELKELRREIRELNQRLDKLVSASEKAESSKN